MNGALSVLLRSNSLLTKQIGRSNVFFQSLRCNSISITRTKKKVYPRMYQVQIVNPDGSSYFVRHSEPVGIIRLPLDPNTLTEEEKKARLKRLKDGAKSADDNEEFEKDDVTFDKRAVTRLLRKRKT